MQRSSYLRRISNYVKISDIIVLYKIEIKCSTVFCNKPFLQGEKVRNHKSWFLLTVGVQPRSQNALLPQMSDHPLAINQAQVELSEKTKETIYLGNPIP